MSAGTATIVVLFQVEVSTKSHESVCVVGDCDQLGNWNPHKAVTLRRNLSKPGEVWAREIHLPAKDVHYRYFKCQIRRADHEDTEHDVNVTAWETNRRPRVFKPMDTFMERGPETFGTYNGKTSIDNGWLLGQTEIQLRLFDNPVHMWKSRTKNQKYRIRCRTMDLRYKDVTSPDLEEDEDSRDVLHHVPHTVLVSILKGKDFEDSIPHDQEPYGTLYNPGDFFLFRTQTMEPEFLAFVIEFFVEVNENSQDPPTYVGNSYLLPVNMRDTRGEKSVHINGTTHKPIGQLTVDYLIIKPLPNVHQDMTVSFAKHWKKRPTVEVGHRGMGTSKLCSTVRENTLASFQTVGNHGADMIEFDVQLSKDLIPVIYHDFHVCLTLRGKKKEDLRLFALPIKDLTLEQLQMLKLDSVHDIDGSDKDLNEEMLDPLDQQPCPKLRDVFEHVDPHVGFDIEIKYPMNLKDGTHEQYPYFERNKFLDVILTEIFHSAGDRRIIFSAFDPDVCTMLKRKQNKYPVLLLTNGCRIRNPRNDYVDIRTFTSDIAMCQALAESYLGVDVHAEDLLRHKDLVKKAHQLNLVVFTWGEDVNNPDVIDTFKRSKVDGIIYDKIWELKKEGNIFKMEHDSKVQLLEAVGVLTNGSNTVLPTTSQSVPANLNNLTL